MNRRDALKLTAMGTAIPLYTPTAIAPKSKSNAEANFSFCLNTSTISKQVENVKEAVKIAAEAGYNGIELWVRDVRKFLNQGHSAEDLRDYIADHGLVVESAIGFAPWLKGDEGQALMRDDMELMASIGCKRIAAPPAGLDSAQPLDLFYAGEQYHKLLELGRQVGIHPLLEFWGVSPHIYHLGQAMMVAAVANHADASILADVYHMFRGGSGFDALRLLNGTTLPLIHINDYPADVPREQQTDKDRIYPGDGAAPLDQILRDLKRMGGKQILSLELFNLDYLSQDAATVAKTCLDRIRSLVDKVSE